MLLLGAFYFIFMSSKTLKNVGAGAAAGTACLAFNRRDRNASPGATPTWVNKKGFFFTVVATLFVGSTKVAR